MRFIFDCEDELCLPAAYKLVDEFKPFIEKVKKIEIDENETKKTRSETLKAVLKNIMVVYPKETGELLSKMWILEDGEKAPNIFHTMATLFNNKVAMDFFTSVMPSILQLSKDISPLLK